MHGNPRRLRELTPPEALRRLGSVPMGRMAFTMNALPTIRPVHHIMRGVDVIIRCHRQAVVLTAVDQVVAFEADSIDADTTAGWSVIVTGVVSLIDDDGELLEYADLLRPWTDQDQPLFLRIHPEIITGYEIIDQDAAAAS